MASNPPLETEDSDEDFFDKLVNDDDDDDRYKITSSSSGKATESANVNDTNEARAFANLSINDDGNALTDWGKVDIGGEEEDDDKAASPISGGLKDESTSNRVDPGQSLVSSHSFAFDNVNDSTSGGLKGESTGNQVDPGQSLVADYSFAFDNVNEEPNNEIGMVKQSGYHGMGGASDVKEVQWSAFTAPVENGGNDFGSYSDFFTEFGDNLGVETGKGDNFISSESKLTGDSFHVENSSNYSHQFQENQSYTTSGEQNTDGQDPNNSQYWENLYPGWKYDSNTGQWYQVDGGYDATGAYNSNSASDWTGSNVKTQVSYSQHTAQSYGGSVSDKGTTESVTSWSPVSQSSHSNENFSNWNQSSQGNNGYPSHMYFDPQYPGWYYDMNAQEWRSLDEYNSQMTAHAQHQVDQNGFSSTNSYYGNDTKIYDGQSLLDKQSGSEVSGSVSQGQDYNWNGSFGNVNQQGSTMWQRDSVDKSASTSYLKGNQQVQNHYGSNFPVDNNVNQQQSYDYGGTGSSFNKSSQVHNEFPAVSGSQSFVPNRNFSQSFNQSTMEQSEMVNASKGYDKQSQISYSQQSVQSGIQKLYASSAGRSSAGRPPHALVTFGFGGKIIVMKDATSLMTASYGGQDSSAGSISVLNLAETVTGADASSSGTGVRGYFHTLCRQSFPGPLASGSVSGRELNKWIDERITHPTDMDYRKREVLRLLLSLLKIASQHYGKLRSPFGTDTTSKENDAPEVAVARLFASAKKNGAEYGDYGAFVHCLQQLPSEGQTQATAAEVQTLLVSGRKIEALHCAQEGQLWGPALVLAAKLGDQFYVDTIKKMALRQLVAGSPLRTLCLLIAGQPADVFSTDTTLDGGMAGDVNMFQQPAQAELGANGMLGDWEENLAMITANRTKDDELVLIHLGDCLWKETSNIFAAHICYLVAEANFEPYSDSARLCLIGADHWKHPRTYACPEAIQRTEVYEYSMLLGNSQFTLLPFQPYKLIYAHMLAEVGRVSDSLKYCQVISKSLKTGRAPEVEPWRQMVSSLEERIKTHQQGGFSTNLAPGKLVGKLLNLFDSTAHRVVGGLPPPVPSTSSSGAQNDHYQYHQPTGPRVSSSQSTMAMSSLMPSASMEPIDQKSAEGNNRRIMHNRSVSEPDFGRSPRQVVDQVDSSKENAADSQSRASVTSRFGRFGFGSQLLQKTVGLVLKPRQDKQAKLGETNKFYYDEKLKRWVEEGVDPPAEEAALPPPPTKATFQNGSSDYASKSAVKSEGSFSNGSSEFSSSSSVAHSSGIPPIPSASNQFSARGRTGVRARYVDTFNQGGGNPTKLFQSPSAPSIAPAPKPNPKFFIPMAVPSTDTSPEKTHQPDENPTHFHSFQTPSYQSPMSRFASMDDISKSGTPSFPTTSSAPRSRRTVSWGGSTDEGFSVSSSNNNNNNNTNEMKPLGDGLGMPPSTFMPTKPHLISGETGYMPSKPHSISSETGYMPSKPHSISDEMGYGSTDDLHEVEL